MPTPDRPDPLDQLRALRPGPATLDTEWPRTERDELRAELGADHPTRPPRFVARSRRPLRRIAVPVAAAAVAALMAGTLIAVMRDRGAADNTGLPPAGEPFTAAAIVATPAVGARQYAFRETTAYTVHNGTLRATGTIQDWVAPNGTTWSYRTEPGSTSRDCYQFVHEGDANFQNPTKAWIDSLPTESSALQQYVRSHVSGSTSREEATFVAVSDLLGAADLLASSRLRSAFVEVLSRTAGVAVHRDVRDSRGHAAVRADFVDPRNRPGELESLYFDPRTFQLVERTSRATTPTAYSSQSYTVAPPSATTSDHLPPAVGTTLVTAERVVDKLPTKVAGCPVQK